MVCSFFAIDFIAHHQFTEAFFVLILALFIDGVDGTFARFFRVSEVLPSMNGKTMDYIIDFANYAIIPAYFLYECGWQQGENYVYLLPEEWRWLIVSIVLVVSALYYGKEGMVDNEYHFVGFPVMWNVVAFYLFFVFESGPWLSFWMLLLFAVLHFVPLKYPYPSRTRKFMWANIGVSLIATFINLWLLWAYMQGDIAGWLKWASIAGAGYYIFMTFWYTFDSGMRKESSPENTSHG